MRLSQAKIGDKLKITKINESGTRRRLLDFGFIPGTIITINNIAPLGGTMLLSLRGYTLALRELACDNIEVSYLESGSTENGADGNQKNNEKKSKGGEL